MHIKYINCDNCSSVENEDVKALEFRVQKITLKHDNASVGKIIKAIKEKADMVKFNPADSSGQARTKQELYLKSFMGLLIEEVCFQVLSKHNASKNILIVPDKGNTSKDQVDIKILKKWRDDAGETKESEFEIEIRSSFPFKNIESVVCSEFDVLGPYVNDTKKYENAKDFYLRFLFALDYRAENYIYGNNNKINYNKTTTQTLAVDYFDDLFCLKKDLVIYFVGGATKSMMFDESLSYIGDMKSDSFNQQGEGKYRKIKLKNSLDSISILRLILGVVGDESTKGK